MREGQPRPQQPKENQGDSILGKINRAKKGLIAKVLLGATLAGSGYGVGHEVGRAEMVSPEQERTEQNAEELAEELEDMIELIDEHASHMRNRNDMLDGVTRETEIEEERKIKDYIVIFAQALGMTPDFQIDPSVHPTWQKSEKSDEVYKLLNQVLSRSGSIDRLNGRNGDQILEALRQQAMYLKGVESK
ncbi:MAG: hypothetical protein US42_C0003G0015 [Candidatus Magasanikbacteria bacterium GW2011_GWC2_37_14]|uniref:Uncharacterized protein n=1 Tax=Candidatus Magasanikbacteria bacterium GW2011_GWC2_37_14 TaxID=1619046 RepID=A0A0G0GA13_9BACT|nr:MAG: hypothetical protein US42_C0003G0015 [Candidatus Magasanikbacteria bacterium GW2011_GWC2_37_14]